MPSTRFATIEAFNDALDGLDRETALLLRRIVDEGLPEAESKIWHAHPVWFLNGNPIVGYSRLKDCMRLLFWSGQGFATPGLVASGTFKAAELRFTSPAQVDRAALLTWLGEARTIQWDYKNIMKNRGQLERLG